jgi:hypothetical protein
MLRSEFDQYLPIDTLAHKVSNGSSVRARSCTVQKELEFPVGHKMALLASSPVNLGTHGEDVREVKTRQLT